MYAYVASGTAGLLIIDVSNPSAPIQVGGYNTPGNAQAVEAIGDIAYVADSQGGLRIVDVSVPSAPIGIGFYNTAGMALDVAVAGNLESPQAGGPALPALSGRVAIDLAELSADSAHEDAFAHEEASAEGPSQGMYAYVADGEEGLRILDVSVPASPTEVGFYDTPGTAQGVSLTGVPLMDLGSASGLSGELLAGHVYAYVADAWSGVRIVDVSDPSTPVEVGFYDAPGNATGVAVAEESIRHSAAPGAMPATIYLAGGDGGLRIMRFDEGPVPLLFTPDAPNGRVGEWHSFTVGFRDPNGWEDIARVQMNLGRTLNDTQGLNVMYRPSEDGLYLKNATGPGWLGPCAPGERIRLLNGVVQLDCFSSSVSHDGGQELQVSWRARWVLQVGEPRDLDAYLRAVDQSRNDSGFEVLGTWTLLPR
jgi:hypothetical protein